jgi:hypothetical protein
VLHWADDNLLHLKWEEIGEYYGRSRLHLPEAERAMARSLERYGQLSPVVVCQRQEPSRSSSQTMLFGEHDATDINY